jgi:hypothetical protein
VNPIVAAVITAAGATLVGWFGYLASRRNHRADTDQQMIDQHQEDIVALRAESSAQRARIGTVERQMRIQGDYIGELRRHIADGHPPPPPAWPDGLIT